MCVQAELDELREDVSVLKSKKHTKDELDEINKKLDVINTKLDEIKEYLFGTQRDKSNVVK